MTVAANLEKTRATIREAAVRSGRAPDAVRLVLVSKTVSPERIREAIRHGQTDLGENKVQEGRKKAEALADLPLRWSMIGHLQTNKVKDVLRFADEVQSLDRLSLAEALDKRLQHLGRGLDVLVQVNSSGEASKYGLAPQDVSGFLKDVAACDAIRPKGFMTLATFTPDEAEVRRCFRLLRDVRDRARQDAPQGAALADLSMGMSGDYPWAIEEGATIVRVGQAVFGPRPLPDSHYWPS
ncbi:YggS family pyridoxal phosphate-dependent enzyme [Brevundimonas sp.]|jgi:pyridoxal phosphate enzyme (YggS family)|uniref:YggS family pyridoxal phosphate-dependent enzyme n=1 Tax=Brevundimonas sp. TaxID=1871086 RepID=UPI00160154EA|nr:YggS family pyridoxal phosphate-dependent enzyme [Brevundimonas sp.]MBB1178620.1 YggS family pyridoxal phosphate-dependent enzyme [Pseudomonas sp. FW305-3-2-15-E-TSA4]MBJ7510171.1 YggS family pyridoxal phosphate-dependent enzyme [Brevundimonas sp.]